jgi:hypothetical protein
MRIKNGRFRHVFTKENYIRINNNYISERDKATEIKNIYNVVKQQYINRIENGELSIKLEKIYLNKKLDEYIGSTLDYWIKFIVIVMTACITTSISQSVLERKTAIGTILFMFIVLFMITIFIYRKTIKKEVNEHTYYRICLEVLDELEKEKAEP